MYSTVEGGGAGDARINVRGFSQRNTAVMINGVPVNDMENGWVYWSNWDGVGDATTSIQLQRGLSAVNLATPSIGGTLNVITDPTANDPGVQVKQEFGSGSFFKTTATGSTGEQGKFALTGAFVRKTGDGIVDGLWTEGLAYYIASSYQLNARNRLELYALGAPTRHGQRLYALNAATYSHEFAAGLDGYDPAALSEFPEAGKDWNPNYGTVSSSYTGEQYASTGPKTGTFDRHSADFINERENYYHKPQVNLNWYSYLGNGLTLSTVAYYSGGSGGGTGTLGSVAWDYTYTQRFADWNATIDRNETNATGSRGILRNSVNKQWTIGAISKLRKDFDSGITGEVGLDWRTAAIDHYREVRDLLGGSYFLDDANAFTGEIQAKLGDKVDYYNRNKVNWIGGYAQAEKSTENGSVYAMGGVSAISYNFEDFFKQDPDNASQTLKLKSGALTGYQIKGGVVRNVTQEWSLFGNAGWVSKVPIFDGVIDDGAGVKNPDPKNETFLSFEAGVKYRSLDRMWSFDANVYHTTWKDRTYNLFIRNLQGTGQDGLVNLLGVDARHMGIEATAAFQPSDLLRFDLAGSIGDWKYLNDVTGTYRPDEGSGDVETYDFYLDGLYVGDAPQMQVAYSASVFPIAGLNIQLVGKSYAKNYADFEPFDRTSEDEAGKQSWKAPGYSVFEAHASYRLNNLIRTWNGGDVRLFANVYNLFDSEYVQDATDNSSFNGFDGDHNADDAEIFMGFPRTVNLGFQVIF